MSQTIFRIHPSIGFARVGTAQDFYLAPETSAGEPGVGGGPVGGLPIKRGTESDPITSSDLREPGTNAMMRQAQRFRIYAYASEQPETYPMGQAGTEIQLGTKLTIDGNARTVAKIIWTVHVANKKAAWYESPDDDGIIAWFKTNAQKPQPNPPLRNQAQGSDATATARLSALMVDPGPRAITAAQGQVAATVQIDAATTPSYYDATQNKIVELGNYPKAFPSDLIGKLAPPPGEQPINQLFPPGVEVIDTLGTLTTDAQGRLLVAGGHGRANSFNPVGPVYGFTDAVNNDWWFDDTSDGPVEATLVFDDGSTHTVEGSAWIVCTDPSYAPQIANVVSLWDDIYDSWLRKLDLRPEVYNGGKPVDGYQPSFLDEIRPIFASAGLQRWIANLNTLGIGAHANVAAIGASDDPAGTQLGGLGLIRQPVDPDTLELSDPNDPNKIDPPGRGDPVDAKNPGGDDRRMPMGLGDAGRSLLSLTEAQYNFLKRWDRKRSDASKRIELNAGEQLDKAALQAGLGGRFSPGIDMTYICREANLYVQDWQSSGTGPFRISQKPIDYGKLSSSTPALTLGWVPRRPGNDSLEPGDISKFMAIPWHADYNSCGTHQPAPNLPQGNTLYWSWPAQRPLAVHVAKDMSEPGQLPKQRYSVRGKGTQTYAMTVPPFGPADPSEVGRYQATPQPGDKYRDGRSAPIDADSERGIMRILDHWMEIGTVIQASQIDDEFPAGKDASTWTYDPSHFLEVKSQFGNDENPDPVVPWPNTINPKVDTPS